MITQKTY